MKFLFTCKYKKENPNTEQIGMNSGYHQAHNIIITDSTDIFESIITEINYMLQQVEQFQNEQSGWQFDQVEHFDISIDPFEPLGGSSYIPLAKTIENRKAIINVRNEKDHECYKWSVTSKAFPKNKNPQRLDL